VYIITRLATNGALSDLLYKKKKKKKFSDIEKYSIALDIIEGIIYLHSRDQPIIHRDLKSLNILVRNFNKKSWIKTIE
jgi:serine/threonine protein kinase